MGALAFNEASGASELADDQRATNDATAAAPQENIADKYDHTQLNVAINMALRLNADTMEPGGTLDVHLPNDGGTVSLPILDAGMIDPDVLSADEMVDPATQDNQPIPGFVVDMSPLYGGEKGGYGSLMLDPNESRPPASMEALTGFGINDADAQAYLDSAVKNGGTLPVAAMKFESGSGQPQVEQASAAAFKSVGMDAAAAATAPDQKFEDVAPKADTSFGLN